MILKKLDQAAATTDALQRAERNYATAISSSHRERKRLNNKKKNMTHFLFKSRSEDASIMEKHYPETKCIVFGGLQGVLELRLGFLTAH